MVRREFYLLAVIWYGYYSLDEINLSILETKALSTRRLSKQVTHQGKEHQIQQHLK